MTERTKDSLKTGLLGGILFAILSEGVGLLWEEAFETPRFLIKFLTFGILMGLVSWFRFRKKRDDRTGG